MQLQDKLREEEQERNQLFDGAYLSPETSAGQEDLTVEQLVYKAERTHKDTTATANRALKVDREEGTMHMRSHDLHAATHACSSTLHLLICRLLSRPGRYRMKLSRSCMRRMHKWTS